MHPGILACAAVAACMTMWGFAWAQEPTPQTAQQQTLGPAEQAEIAAAEANNSRIAKRPQWISGPDAEYPDSERALGHHGKVEVRALLGTDGRLRHATIATSSRALVLDANALAAAVAATYRPAEDASGNPIAIMTTVPMEFYSYTSSEGVGAALYTCRQFVLDMDWWRSAFSEKTFADHEFYLLIRGLGFVSRLHMGAARALESNESFTRRWNQAIETCRDRPGARFADAMKPEGDIIDRMAAQHRRRSR
jgi:TonB family protein